MHACKKKKKEQTNKQKQPTGGPGTHQAKGVEVTASDPHVRWGTVPVLTSQRGKPSNTLNTEFHSEGYCFTSGEKRL